MATKIENWKKLVSKIIRKYNKQSENYMFKEDDFEAFLDANIPGFGNGKFQVLESKSAHDGYGNCSIIFKWKDTYYKLEVDYSSYSGYEWSDAEMYEVIPEEKPTVVYHVV